VESWRRWGGGRAALCFWIYQYEELEVGGGCGWEERQGGKRGLWVRAVGGGEEGGGKKGE